MADRHQSSQHHLPTPPLHTTQLQQHEHSSREVPSFSSRRPAATGLNILPPPQDVPNMGHSQNSSLPRIPHMEMPGRSSPPGAYRQHQAQGAYYHAPTSTSQQPPQQGYLTSQVPIQPPTTTAAYVPPTTAAHSFQPTTTAQQPQSHGQQQDASYLQTPPLPSPTTATAGPARGMAAQVPLPMIPPGAMAHSHYRHNAMQPPAHAHGQHHHPSVAYHAHYGGGHPMGQHPHAVYSNIHQPNGQMAMLGNYPAMSQYGNMPQGSMYVPHGHNARNDHQDRPYKCDTCHQSFNRNHDLKRHKRIHLAVKPFPCNQCDKSFSRKDALKVSRTAQHLNDN